MRKETLTPKVLGEMKRRAVSRDDPWLRVLLVKHRHSLIASAEKQKQAQALAEAMEPVYVVLADYLANDNIDDPFEGFSDDDWRRFEKAMRRVGELLPLFKEEEMATSKQMEPATA
jgi:hypothetical protein